jgi:hypothetical protein
LRRIWYEVRYWISCMALTGLLTAGRPGVNVDR